MQRLRVSEIFYSLQGETRTVGLPTVFVRLTGCPLRCQYCDTAYAFQGGGWMSLADILEKVAEYSPRYVTLTGGEPMAQKGAISLLSQLCDAGYEVSLETSGAMPLNEVDPRVVKVVDIKTPGSKEVDKNHWDNLNILQPHDQIKFVLCSEADYLWAKQIILDYNLNEKCEILLSPSYTELHPGLLADWIVADRLQVRLQVQLHKYLWGDVQGK